MTQHGPNDEAGQPATEYLDTGGDGGPRRRARTGVVAAATVAVLGAAGAGAWGVSQFLGGGGPGAAEALPADTLAYLALDLDPDAGQKVEAYRTLRKFPAVSDELGPGDDLRRSLVEGVLSGAPCDDLTFEDDFAPWLGDRVAVALVPGGAEPAPVVAVQVTDEAAALAGVEAIGACSPGSSAEEAGTAFVGDYLLLAETDAVAERVAADAAEASLADDEAFTGWVDEAGGTGIVTGYLAAAAAEVLVDKLGVLSHEARPTDGSEELEGLLADFTGAAMVVRFADGALEVETAASALDGVPSSGGSDSGLADLPGTTAAGLGFGVGDTTVLDLFDAVTSSVDQDELDVALERAERETGLTLPEDLQTLLGDGVAVALDASFAPEALLGFGAGSPLPAGVRIVGDPAEIVPVLEKLLAMEGAEGQVVVVEGDGVVAVGLSAEYLGTLAGDGDLGERDGFTRALPGFADGAGGLYVDFDAGDWLTGLAESAQDEELLANLEPLDSLGVSLDRDGDVMRAVLRLTTD